MPISRLAQHNKRLKAAFVKHGFSIENKDDSIAWYVRRQHHRELVGHYFVVLGAAADFNRALQLGSCEADAKPCARGSLRFRAMSSEADDKDVWILAPGAAYIARGKMLQLRCLVQEADEEARAIQQRQQNA